MAVDGGDVILFHQVSDELEEGEALGFGACVGGMPVGIEAADIGDTDTVGVVAGQWAPTSSTGRPEWTLPSG